MATVGATQNHLGMAATVNERPAQNEAEQDAKLEVEFEVAQEEPGRELEAGLEQVELKGKQNEGLESEHSKEQE
jgi:hypothetical protein